MKQAGNINLQFVTVTKPGRGWKSSNEHVVRSHVMKYVRRQKRAEVQMKQTNSLTIPPLYDAREKKSDEENAAQSVHVSSPVESRNPDLTLQGHSKYQLENIINDLRQNQFPTPQLSAYAHRLLLHISNFYSPLLQNLTKDFVLWTKGVKLFVTLAFSHDFLMHAILAWSACHLAEVMGNSTLEHHAYRHRLHALKGLQRAIDSFSKDNADAILCTSIALSWQSKDAKSWIVMKRGCETVRDRMATWNKLSFFDTSMSEAQPLRIPSPIIHYEYQINSPNDIYQPSIDREALIDEALDSLSSLRLFAEEFPSIMAPINELITFIKTIKEDQVPYNGSSRPQRLKPLKEMLFWFPSRYLPNLSTHPSVPLLMAHLHASALITVPLKDNDSASFRRLNVPPIQSFYEEFSLRTELELKSGQSHGPHRRALALMRFPLRAVAAFQCWLDNFQNGRPCFSMEGLTASTSKPDERQNMPMIRALEDFPVGLWCQTLS